MRKMSRELLREAYGYREHHAVLYANEEGVIEPDDLIWHTDDITENYDYEKWKPVAIILCHDSDKMYRLPLDEVLRDPEEWETEILWLDKEWFETKGKWS